MKRVRLKHHKSLALYQTFTDSGHTIGFEIRRRYTIAALPNVSVTNARNTFEALKSVIKLKGLRCSTQSLRQLLTGRTFARHTSR